LAQGVSLPRVQREFGSLRILCEKYDVELERLKDEDYLDEVLAQLELAGYKLNALNEYKKAIRFFLRDILKCPELASKVRRKEPRDNELTRDDLLTVDEVLKLVSVAMNDRDPALIMCHLDLACRPEEVLTLTVGDFIRDSWGIRVEMRRSKTRRRSPHLSFSLPYISRWLNAHPLKDGPTAPMWIDLNRFRQGVVVPIDNAAYNRILDRLFRRAKIKKNKRFSPYKFRHTGMTMWSVLLTEMQLCKRSGHVPGSKYLKRYTKLVDADTDRKILKELGLISEAEAEPKVKKLSPVKCNLCGEFNEPFRQRCWKCKAALDPARLVTEFREEEIIDVALDDEIWRKIETG
jgi:integrase